MKAVFDIAEIRTLVSDLKKEGKVVSVVPTMGNLHQGHMSLVRRARKESDVVIVSIFVNPAQFGPSEDFNKYPRTIEEDLLKIKEAGCDIVFTPEVKEIYPDKRDSNKSFNLFVSESKKSKVLCGKFRPGHFDGVLTIVLKLFNICTPDKAFFGLKDYQQYILIRDMIKALNLNVEIIPCDLIRDKDGLASSSRNSYLSVDQRIKALSINRALSSIKGAFEEGESNVKTLKSLGLSIIMGSVDVQYIEIMDEQNLDPITEGKKGNLVAVAGFCGDTRLIDNIIL